jgi:hypothetical protein
MDDHGATTETRFVVITHNPITMARMNRLWGVTMAEQRRQPAGVGRPARRRGDARGELISQAARRPRYIWLKY